MLEPWQRSVLAWWMRDSVDNIDRTRQRLEDHRNRLARN